MSQAAIAARMYAARAAANPGADVRALYAQQGRGISNSSFPYYSRVRINAPRTGAGPFVYTIAAGTEVQAFGYAKAADMAPGGRAGVVALPNDTNLLQPGETVQGQVVRILGVGIMALPTSDGELVRTAFPELSVAMSLNGDAEKFFLGNPLMNPGGGGLHGQMHSPSKQPPLPASFEFAFLGANGNPQVGNFRQFPVDVVWMPGGQQDGNLRVFIKAERAVAIGAADRAAAAGTTAAFTSPADGGVFLDLMVQLDCYSEAPLSVNR